MILIIYDLSLTAPFSVYICGLKGFLDGLINLDRIDGWMTLFFWYKLDQ